MEKIQKFTDLKAWQEGHKLALMIYTVTKEFPKEELFALTNQIRRAAVSVTSNIAEGFSRRSKAEKVQFYYIAQGSVTEIQNQLLLARDVGYTSVDDCKRIADQTVVVQKLLYGLIKSIKAS
jgi:four helix bundle protein